MALDSDEIWVAGYHVEDLGTQVDLTKLGVQDILKFDQGILMAKKNCKLEIFHGDYQYVFTIKLKLQHSEEKDGYYIMKGGGKYELEEPPVKKSLSDSTKASGVPPEGDGPISDSKTALRLPCSSKAWGGGGTNLILALRNLSHRRTTNIRYWDVVFEPSVQDLVGKLQNLHNESKDTSGKFAQDRIDRIIDIVAEHGRDECIEIFLRTKHIEFNLFQATSGGKKPPPRTNLVFSRVTDGINTIGDRIILKSPVTSLTIEDHSSAGSMQKDLLVQHIKSSQSNSSTVVVNTVKHYEVFEAILSAFQSRMDACPDNGAKLFVMFTDDNRAWFALLKKENESLYQSIRKHVWAIFNESEFSKFMYEIDSAKKSDASFLFGDGTPNFSALQPLCTQFVHSYQRDVASRLYVTLGKHGSAGVDEHSRLIYVRTYPTRGVPIYDTTGSGDSWAGTVILLEHHARDLGRKSAEMSRFMRIASGTAWAKMTSPLGEVRVHELISLLDNDYIAWTIIGDTIQGKKPKPETVNEGGYARRIPKASSIDYQHYSSIINWM